MLGRTKKILVVDDEAETLEFLSNTLKRANYAVISTTSGNEALNLAKEQKPDLIILDLVLPDRFGGEVASIISKDNATNRIPIIIVTGYANNSAGTESEQFGKHYFMSKPIESKKLLDIIKKILSS